MQGLTGAHQQLKVSADKLNISKKALEEVEKAPEGACRAVLQLSAPAHAAAAVHAHCTA